MKIVKIGAIYSADEFNAAFELQQVLGTLDKPGCARFEAITLGPDNEMAVRHSDGRVFVIDWGDAAEMALAAFTAEDQGHDNQDDVQASEGPAEAP